MTSICLVKGWGGGAPAALMKETVTARLTQDKLILFLDLLIKKKKNRRIVKGFGRNITLIITIYWATWRYVKITLWKERKKQGMRGVSYNSVSDIEKEADPKRKDGSPQEDIVPAAHPLLFSLCPSLLQELSETIHKPLLPAPGRLLSSPVLQQWFLTLFSWGGKKKALCLN